MLRSLDNACYADLIYQDIILRPWIMHNDKLAITPGRVNPPHRSDLLIRPFKSLNDQLHKKTTTAYCLVIFYVAEEEGFEPSRAVNPTRFPVARHKPD